MPETVADEEGLLVRDEALRQFTATCARVLAVDESGAWAAALHPVAEASGRRYEGARFSAEGDHVAFGAASESSSAPLYCSDEFNVGDGILEDHEVASHI